MHADEKCSFQKKQTKLCSGESSACAAGSSLDSEDETIFFRPQPEHEEDASSASHSDESVGEPFKSIVLSSDRTLGLGLEDLEDEEFLLFPHDVSADEISYILEALEHENLRLSAEDISNIVQATFESPQELANFLLLLLLLLLFL